MKITYRITGPHAGEAFKVNLLSAGNTIAVCDSHEAAAGLVQVLNALNRHGIALIHAATTPPETLT